MPNRQRTRSGGAVRKDACVVAVEHAADQTCAHARADAEQRAPRRHASNMLPPGKRTSSCIEPTCSVRQARRASSRAAIKALSEVTFLPERPCSLPNQRLDCHFKCCRS
eukprot:1618058-Pleurochrysis_carterae.AAC.1